MARNNFIGWTKVNLEAELLSLQQARLNLIRQSAAGDSSAETHIDLAHNQTLINEVLFALYVLDPTTYPANVAKPVKRTVPVFQV